MAGCRTCRSANATRMTSRPTSSAFGGTDQSLDPEEVVMPKPVPNTQTGSLTDHQRGTNDTLNGSFLYGDAYSMYDDSKGGNDSMTAVENAFNTLYGDASEMHDNTVGG